MHCPSINDGIKECKDYGTTLINMIEATRQCLEECPLEYHYLTKGIKDVIGEDIGLINEVESTGQFMQTTQHGVINRFTSGN